MAHQELGSDMLKRVETDLEDMGRWSNIQN